MTPEELVLVERAPEGYAVLTLNRPAAMNALSRALRRALTEAIGALAAEPATRVLILTAAGRAFCAGLDLKELASGGDAPALDATPADPVRALGAFPGPVIAAVNGAAVTGGFELALACDFLVASDRARFGDTHARVGVMPGWGLTVLLPEAVGYRRAKELSTTGNFLDAATALSWGLVNHVVPHDELLAERQQLGRDIGSVDRRAVRRMLQTYDEGALRDGAGAWALEGDVSVAWQGAGIDPETIERNRQAVMARGRTQL